MTEDTTTNSQTSIDGSVLMSFPYGISHRQYDTAFKTCSAATAKKLGKSPASVYVIWAAIYIAVTIVINLLSHNIYAAGAIAGLVLRLLRVFWRASHIVSGRRSMNSNAFLFEQPAKINITSDALQHVSSSGTHAFEWSEFHKIVAVGDCYCLVGSESNYFFVPKRCFLTTEETNEFVILVKKLIDAQPVKYSERLS